jgi:hypothetical protein
MLAGRSEPDEKAVIVFHQEHLPRPEEREAPRAIFKRFWMNSGQE